MTKGFREWHITLPSIKSTVLMLILKMGSIISIGFDRPLFSQPCYGCFEVISLFVYYVGLGQGDYKLGTVVVCSSLWPVMV